MTLTTKNTPIDTLTRYHKNARRSNVARIASSLRTNGQYKPVVVNRGTKTGRENEVLAGNHVVEAARSLGWKEVSAVFVDVDDRGAARIVLADNKTSDDSTYDLAVLDELLAELDADDADLDATGFTEIDFLESQTRRELAAEEALLHNPGEEPRAPEGDESPGPGLGTPVISYTLVFDDTGQQELWYAFLKWVRQNQPGGTLAEKITSFVTEAQA